MVIKGMCSRHPGQEAKGVFCWETNTFHCPVCACEKGLKCDSIPLAVEKIIGSTQFNKTINSLNKHKNKVLFELDDEQNPNNLKSQKEYIEQAIQNNFEELSRMLEERKEALVKEVGELFGDRMEQLKEEATKITSIIEKRDDALRTYKKVLSSKEDPEYLKELVNVITETEEVVKMVEYKHGKVSHLDAKLDIDYEATGRKIDRIGEIVGKVDIPAPKNFDYKEKKGKSVILEWSPSETDLPVTYKVLYREYYDYNHKWLECYVGEKTTCRCSKLKEKTRYKFVITPMYKGVESNNWSTCYAKTVNKT